MSDLSIDVSQHTCRPDVTIRKILTRIGVAPHLFQIVIATDGTMLGTVTDGDVRRAILMEISLDASVTECMQKDPVIGQLGDDEENLRKLRCLGSSRPFLPILDNDDRLVDILVQKETKDASISTAVIMAGGLGRRLGARTKDTPKPMLLIGGDPILEHVLHQLESANIKNIHISVHYLADQIHSFIKNRKNRSTIKLMTEDEPRGTAGALSQLEMMNDGPILVVNGDVITKVDFVLLHDFHFRHGYDGTIGIAQHDIEIPYGVVGVGDDGLFAGIKEKPKVRNFIAAGLYFLAPEFINLIPKDQYMDMPELLNLGQSLGFKIGLFPIHEYWIDVGSPKDLEIAEADLTTSRKHEN
jgi:dTDP-glucose pyrophosphorylase